MTNIEWGAPLEGRLLKEWNLPGNTPVNYNNCTYPAKIWDFGGDCMYRLPASHPAYICQAWNEAHPGEEPFVPWCGGDKAPGDWDGGAALLSDPVGEFKPYNELAWTKEPRQFRPVIGYRRRKEPAPQPIGDDSLQAQIGEVGNQVHNIGCELQNNEDVRDRLSELAGRLWELAKAAASEPAAPPGYVLVKQMTEDEWDCVGTLGWTYWARNQGIIRPETRLEQFARESGIAITDANRDGIEAALEWGRQ